MPEPKLSRRSLIRWAGYGAVASLPIVGLADSEAYGLRQETFELRLPRWDAEGFRVAVLSDFHANFQSAVERARSAIRLAIAAKPDLIALPGDFIDASGPEHLRLVDRALEPLHGARCPVVATLGNHDYWTRRPESVMEAVRRSGARLLRNESVEVDGVTVAGIDDAMAGQQRYGFLQSERRSRSLLALFHEPDFVKDVPTPMSLMLSGHSHGGQICLPGGIPIHRTFGARTYLSGYYPEARSPLFVTRGVGTTGPDLRLFCPPEVAILTLRSA